MRYLTLTALALGVGAWAFYAALYVALRLDGPQTIYIDGRLIGSLGPYAWLRVIEVWIEPFILAAFLGVLAVAIVNLMRTWPSRRESET